MTETNKGIFTPFIKQCFVTATVCMNVLSNGCAYGFPAVLLPQLKRPDSDIPITTSQESWIATVCMNVLSNGCASGFPAVLLPQLKRPDSDIPITTSQESWIASVVTIAMLVGNFSMPFIMDRLGRKKAHFIVMIPTTIGWLFIIFATNVQNLILARIMHGLSLGQVIPIRAVIIGELTSPKNRGAFLTMISVAQTTGVFFVHLIGSWVTWKMTAGICVIFTVLSFLMTFVLPESPSWLANNGKYVECKKQFQWLRGFNENDELNELIQARIKHNATPRKVINIGGIVRNAEFYKPIIVSLHISLIMYVSGNMTIAVYGTTIVSQVMGPTVDASLWLLCLDITRIITSFLAVYFIRTFNRRTVTFSSIGLCIVVHIAIISHVCITKYVLSSLDFSWIPAVLLNLQCFSLSSGILPINSIIVGEIFPLAHRSIGISITTAIATGFHFLVLKTFPYLVSGVGIEGVYGVYSIVICYGLAVTWFMMPETKGRTLQQIEDRFKRNEKTEPELESLNNNTKA